MKPNYDWEHEYRMSRLSDCIARLDCSDYQRSLRERWPLRYGQTDLEREWWITTMIIESWSWR